MKIGFAGTGIMGGFEHTGFTGSAVRDPNAPFLRIRGVALMGGVEITERQIGETARDARRRRKRSNRERGEDRIRRLRRGDEGE